MWDLFVKIQQWKHQDILWKLFEVNRKQWRHRYFSGVFTVNFEQISNIFSMLPLLNLNK